MQSLRAIRLGFVGLLRGLGPAGATACSAAATVGAAACSPAAPVETTSELQVGGMVCASCSQAITAALEKLDGVQTVTVDHVSGKAVVRHDLARCSRATLVAAVTALGYTVAAP